MPATMLDTPTESVTEEILTAIADTTGRDPDTLPPLYDVVDPEALNALVNRPPHIGRETAAVEVTFGFAECLVTVSATDGVEVSAGEVTDSTAARPLGDDD